MRGRKNPRLRSRQREDVPRREVAPQAMRSLRRCLQLWRLTWDHVSRRRRLREWQQRGAMRIEVRMALMRPLKENQMYISVEEREILTLRDILPAPPRASGKELWADEHADEYVKRLREGWE